MFGPKRASQKSVYQWSAALTLFTENHSSTEQLMENKSLWRLKTNVWNQDRRCSEYFQPHFGFSQSQNMLFLLFLCPISVSVYVSPPPLTLDTLLSPSVLHLRGGGADPLVKPARAALLTESGCLLPEGCWSVRLLQRLRRTVYLALTILCMHSFIHTIVPYAHHYSSPVICISS